ncbi:MAG TPA: polynucleotide kinase-phosphatase [Trebonia sp.]|nr:polynucleotide kinase-phosphatase [Trebonia sp.]
MSRELSVPELCLVVLVGVSGAGKSTFAAAHFKPTEVVSSDYCRALVADDETDQSATPDAFDVLHYIAGKRLAAGRLTVIDATSVQPESRAPLVALAREHDVLPVAIVLDLPAAVCEARNAARPERDFGAHVIRRQHQQLRRSVKNLQREGFRTVHVLKSADEVADVTLTRTKLFSDLRQETGPFDVIGDVHGCLPELLALLEKLGYTLTTDDAGRGVSAAHPEGRRVIFLGDLVDRGPDSPGVLRLVMGMVAAGTALAVPGNHEDKLLRALRGRNVRVSHGLEETLGQLAAEPEEFRAAVAAFLDGLTSHYVLDEGRLVVAHAGLTERLQGRASGRVRSFCLYGQTTGETDEYGLPVRYPWAEDYRGRAMVLYGHTPVPAPEWVNNTLCLDTGCVFGGCLTALRYPERSLVSVPAARVYYEAARPFPVAAPDDAPVPVPAAGAPGGTPGPVPDGVPAVPSGGARREPSVLDITDVTGTRVIDTGYLPRIKIGAANTAAALEVMSRFAVDPRWLMYLPPTMSPANPLSSGLSGTQPGQHHRQNRENSVSAAPDGDLLEHPEQAFDAYAEMGVREVVCEQKHMGSRAVLLICRSEADAVARFGVPPGMGSGAVWTRTGRPFFDQELASVLLHRVRAAAESAGLFDELSASWLMLDAELLPWSAKAGQLVRDQYAAVGAAARAALPAAVTALEQALARGVDAPAAGGGTADGGPLAGLLARTRSRLANAEAFAAAYERYCWPIEGLSGVRIAPFTLLASESSVHAAWPHSWHLSLASRLAAADPELLVTTRHVYADTGDPASRAAATDWWLALTEAGAEGMVVKPADGLVRGPKGLAQPGLKVRGREYLRIVYGPDYTEPANLARLRSRSVGKKRSLALREYALGLEGLDRAARGEPLWRVHECVFGVLALESEPVDPRL